MILQQVSHCWYSSGIADVLHIHVCMSTDVIIEILFRWPYCWDFVDVDVCHVEKQMSWCFGHYKLSLSSPMIHPVFMCMQPDVNITHNIANSLFFWHLYMGNNLLPYKAKRFLCKAQYFECSSVATWKEGLSPLCGLLLPPFTIVHSSPICQSLYCCHGYRSPCLIDPVLSKRE